MSNWQRNVLELVNGNEERADQIIDHFINETPNAIGQVHHFLSNRQWQQAAAILHRIKSRYGYLGADSVVEEITDWEGKLNTETDFDQNRELNLINKLEEKTKVMIDELEKERSRLAAQGVVGTITGKTVLVAEDDEINAMVFELFVKELGGSVIKVEDGNQAVNAALEKRPDLIFMDVHMPFFSGIEAIKTLRSKGIVCPIISLSASTRLNEKQNSLDAGANEFLIKPARRDSINALLLKYLSS